MGFQTFYVTLGQKHAHGHPRMPELTPEGWLRITAANESDAKKLLDDRLGGDFSMLYGVADFKPEYFPAGEQQHLTITPEGAIS